MGRPRTVSRINYGQFLFSTQINYTQTYFGAHNGRASHDSLNRWMGSNSNHFTSGMFWEHAKAEVMPVDEGYLVFDDTVLDKNYSHSIEMVRRQYSGNTKTLIKGIGIVNCVYVNPVMNKFWIIDHRIYAPEYDGKTKLDHMKEMFDNALYHKKIPFKGVLMDTWYATSEIMQHINHRGKFFYCPVKDNRNIKIGNDEYKRSDSIKWDQRSLKYGHICHLKGLDKNVMVRMFQVVRSTTQNEIIVSNDAAQPFTSVIQEAVSHRWKVEQFHRELKQNTGLESCQCRNHRAQRNHIEMCMLVWLKLSNIASSSNKTIYQLKSGLLDDYIKQQLRSPALEQFKSLDPLYA